MLRKFYTPKGKNVNSMTAVGEKDPNWANANGLIEELGSIGLNGYGRGQPSPTPDDNVKAASDWVKIANIDLDDDEKARLREWFSRRDAAYNSSAYSDDDDEKLIDSYIADKRLTDYMTSQGINHQDEDLDREVLLKSLKRIKGDLFPGDERHLVRWDTAGDSMGLAETDESKRRSGMLRKAYDEDMLSNKIYADSQKEDAQLFKKGGEVESFIGSLNPDALTPKQAKAIVSGNPNNEDVPDTVDGKLAVGEYVLSNADVRNIKSGNEKGVINKVKQSYSGGGKIKPVYWDVKSNYNPEFTEEEWAQMEPPESKDVNDHANYWQEFAKAAPERERRKQIQAEAEAEAAQLFAKGGLVRWDGNQWIDAPKGKGFGVSGTFKSKLTPAELNELGKRISPESRYHARDVSDFLQTAGLIDPSGGSDDFSGLRTPDDADVEVWNSWGADEKPANFNPVFAKKDFAKRKEQHLASKKIADESDAEEAAFEAMLSKMGWRRGGKV